MGETLWVGVSTVRLDKNQTSSTALPGMTILPKNGFLHLEHVVLCWQFLLAHLVIQNQLNSAINANHDSPLKRQRQCLNRDELDDAGQDFSSWIPNNCGNSGSDRPVKVMLLCGADVLESFAKPGLWNIKDVSEYFWSTWSHFYVWYNGTDWIYLIFQIETIVGQHGIVVITREGTNPYRFIYESDVLTKHMVSYKKCFTLKGKKSNLMFMYSFVIYECNLAGKYLYCDGMDY